MSQGERLEGAEGVRLLTQAVEAYREALKVYTRESLPQQWATTQNNLGVVLSSQGERLGGAEGVGLLAQAVEAYRQALKVYTRESLPQGWATTQDNLARAYVLLENWSGAAEAYANVLMIYPDDEKTYNLASLLYHERLFHFEEAFFINHRWLARHPANLSVQADFAEKHFTTSRFGECSQRINLLLTKPEIPASTKTALRAIEIATVLALGQTNSVSEKLEILIREISTQPIEFKSQWAFDGTKHFIAQNEKLTAYRVWLAQLFDAFSGKDRDSILKALQQAKANFKK
jgi:tetratricopeptide (TPR) repeat protein